MSLNKLTRAWKRARLASQDIMSFGNPPRVLGDRWPLVQEVTALQMEYTQMPHITGMVRQGSVPSVRRDSVKAGQVFRLIKKDGTMGEESYGCISQNGKFYSVNLRTGELASTKNGSKTVKVTGRYEIVTRMLSNGARRAATRDQVKDNELYVVKGKKTVYANLGRTMEGNHISLNLGNENHAIGRKDRKRVVVVGTYSIAVEAVRG